MRLTKVVLTVVLTFVLSALALTQAHAASHARGLTSTQKETRNKVAARSRRAQHTRSLRAGQEEAAFFKSVRAGDVRAVRRMLARGADPNAVSERGAPAIVLAAKTGSVLLVRALLDAGAKVNADDRNSYTPLHYAAQSGNLRMVSLLLARGADVNKPGYDDHTVLMFTMQGASWSRMPALLRKFVLREDGEGDEGIVPKYIGTMEGYRRVTARLIEAGADVNVVADCGESALTFASCDAELTKKLLAAGARVDNGASPLCLIGDDMQQKLNAAYIEDLTDVTNERERRAITEALRIWWAETAAQRHEAARLLVEAGAKRHGCGDDDEGEPER